MSSLAPVVHALLLDVRLQRRYGVWGTAAGLTALWVLLLRLAPASARPDVLAVLVFAHMGFVGYTFIGAAVLFEKAEGTLAAVVVTPLRPVGYLAAKIASLLVLALAVAAVLAAASGTAASVAPLLAGVVLLSAVGLLAGFCAVVPFDSLSRWVLPSVPPLLVLASPLALYGGVPVGLLRGLPTTGALTLLRAGAGSGPVDPPAVAAGALWAAGLGLLAVRMFRRYLVGAGGSR